MLTTSATLNAAALTDPGREREINEDTVYQYVSRTAYDQAAGLFIVCDGLGGHRAGDVASQLAMQTTVAELAPVLRGGGESPIKAGNPDPRTLPRWLRATMVKANTAIRQRAQSDLGGQDQMGTTMTAALIIGPIAYFAHIGDSRAYLLRQDRIIQITRDHSLAAELATHGHINEADVATHPRSNVLSRALGREEDVEPDLSKRTLQAGDRLLLCSDGLWKAFSTPAELASWMGEDLAPAEICVRLVDEANRRDGSDNISTVVVDVAERLVRQEGEVLARDVTPTYDKVAITV